MRAIVYKMKKKRFFDFILVVVLFTSLSALVTYPLLLNLSNAIYGAHSDSVGTVSFYWLYKYSIERYGFPIGFVPIIQSPFGADVGHSPYQPYEVIMAYIISLVSNEVVAYNLNIFIGFVLSGVAMYYLAFYLTRNRTASILSGIIFTFSPYHLGVSMNSATISSFQWIPLFVLFLFKLDENRTYKNAVLAAVFFVLSSFSSYYFFLDLSVFIALFIAFKVFYPSIKLKSGIHFNYSNLNIRPPKDVLKLCFVFILVVVVLFLPFKGTISGSSIKEVGGQRARLPSDVLTWAAAPWNFVLPSPYNPVFGGFIKHYWFSHQHYTGYQNNNLFVGYTALALALLGFFSNRSEKRWFFVLVMLVSLLFMTGPPVKLGGDILYIPVFGIITNIILPFFRNFTRFDVLLMLGIALLAGFGLKHLMSTLPDRKRDIVTLLIFSLIFVEFISIPPTTMIEIPKTPGEYVWLAGQPGIFNIIEYPLDIMESGEPLGVQEYTFFQRVHKKGLFNYPLLTRKQKQFALAVSDIENPKTPSVLAYLNISYVLVHNDKFSSPPKVPAEGIVYVSSFGDTDVYRITSKPADVILLPTNNFFPANRRQDLVLHGLRNSAEIGVLNTQETHKDIYLEFSGTVQPWRLHSAININRDGLYCDKETPVDVILNGKTVETVPFSCSEFSQNRVRLSLEPGVNKVIFSIASTEPVSTLEYHNIPDRNLLLIFFSNISIDRIE